MVTDVRVGELPRAASKGHTVLRVSGYILYRIYGACVQRLVEQVKRFYGSRSLPSIHRVERAFILPERPIREPTPAKSSGPGTSSDLLMPAAPLKRQLIDQGPWSRSALLRGGDALFPVVKAPDKNLRRALSAISRSAKHIFAVVALCRLVIRSIL